MTTTYADEQALKSAQKEERAWKRTMKEARVYIAARLPTKTAAVAGDLIVERLLKTTGTMIAQGNERVAKFAASLVADPARTFEWSREEFDAAADVKVGVMIQAAVTSLRERGDEYDALSSIRIAEMIKEDLLREVIRAARYPERSTSVQSNEIARSIAQSRAKVLEDMNNWFMFHA